MWLATHDDADRASWADRWDLVSRLLARAISGAAFRTGEDLGVDWHDAASWGPPTAKTADELGKELAVRFAAFVTALT